MPAPMNLVGQRFGRLLVLGPAPKKQNYAKAWRCLCDCGKESTPTTTCLTNGNSQSCGCLRDERALAVSTKHGRTRTREHRAWLGMRRRCHEPSRADYKWYGARGIAVCPEWRESFSAFFRDVGPCPAGLTLDRIDPALGYQPGNCRWATPQAQANNRRTNHRITFRGETHTLAEWSRLTGLSVPTLQLRINRRKWPIELALTVPPQTNRHWRNVSGAPIR